MSVVINTPPWTRDGKEPMEDAGTPQHQVLALRDIAARIERGDISPPHAITFHPHICGADIEFICILEGSRWLVEPDSRQAAPAPPVEDNPALIIEMWVDYHG